LFRTPLEDRPLAIEKNLIRILKIMTDEPTPNASSKVRSRLHEQIELDSLRPELEDLCISEQTTEAIETLKKWITGNPLEEKAFVLLGELYERAGLTHSAAVAFQRAMQLKEVSAAYQPSVSLKRYLEIEENAAENNQDASFSGSQIQTNLPNESRATGLKSHVQKKVEL